MVAYETDIDIIYKIVEKRGKVKISLLANYFGISKKKIEELAAILENHKLLRIHYPFIGEPELRKWKK